MGVVCGGLLPLLDCSTTLGLESTGLHDWILKGCLSPWRQRFTCLSPNGEHSAILCAVLIYHSAVSLPAKPATDRESAEVAHCISGVFRTSVFALISCRPVVVTLARVAQFR